MIRNLLQQLWWGTALCAVYIGAGKVGLSLAFLNSKASPVWPPTGLAMAALLLWGWRFWPAIFIGAFVVNFSPPDGHLAVSLGIAAGNTLEALIGASIARRWACGANCFAQVPDIFRYVIFAAIPSTLVSAATGIASLTLAGQVAPGTAANVFLTWWTGDLTSDLVLAPLLIVWLSSPPPRLKPGEIIELVSLLACLILSMALAFGPWNSFAGRAYPLAFLVLPPLLWAAYRFRYHGAVFATALLSTVAVTATVRRYGPFALPSPNDSLLVLQAFIGCIALSIFVLAAVVSDRARWADSLRENQDQLLMALDAGKMGTWDWDISNGTIRYSAGVMQMHGLSSPGGSATYEELFKNVHPEDRPRVQEQLARTLKEHRDHHVQCRLLRSDGTIRWVEGRGRLILDAGGNPVRMVGVTVDITRNKNANEEREQLLERERAARAEAERANRTKDHFLAVLSHELRTPLTPVLLTASMLENDPQLPDSVRSDVQMIRRNVEMEARLIDDLLDLTRVTRGKVQLELQTTDLHEIVHRALEISCHGANVNVQTELKAEHTLIHADPGRIQQVLWNLLNNARKFTPADGTIAVRSSNPDANSIRVDVSDTGVGILPESLPKLFLAFEQADSAEAKRAGGLGLGLAISKALVNGHKGTLTAHSEGPGKGATFTVVFPTVTEPAAVEKKGGNGSPTADGKRARILVVEDNAGTMAVLRRLLTARNHLVVEATSVASAKEAAAREPVDLIISDLGLPDGVGHDLMRELGKQARIRGIAISARGMAEDIDQSRRAGFVEHLVKPIDAAALDAAISRALES